MDAKNLELMATLCEKFGHPERFCPCFHVAGSKGKGAIAAGIAAILREKGFKTGVYSSPHVYDINERFSTGDGPFEPEIYEKARKELQAKVKEKLPWPVEMTLFAMLVFREAKVDYAIYEVGVGGRLDPTNVISPLAIAMGPVELEHTQILGDTLTKIATEKAGIFKPNVPVISAPQPSEVKAVFGKIEYLEDDEYQVEDVNFFVTSAKVNGFTPTADHVFVEWNTSSDGSGVSVLAGDLTGDAAAQLGLLPGDTLTLYAIWGEESTLSYDVNGGMGQISPVTVTSTDGTFSFIVSSVVPTRLDYTLVGWSTDPTSQTADYLAGDTFTTNSRTNTLYAVWAIDACPANKVCYRANGAERGTSLTLTPSSGVVALRASDYERAGYGFTGWNTEPDGTGTQYGPQQSVTITDDLSSEGKPLYANWLASSGDMQTWSSCSALSVGSVVALTDNRDNNTYTIAKLQDGNCWMVENLRLDPSKVVFTTTNTNSPTPDFIIAAPNSATSTNLCNQDTAGCVNQIAFDTNNINRGLPASPTLNDSKSSWYSYGVWYNWYTATAGNGVRDILTGDVTGDICPAGWRLPTGGPGKEFVALNNAVNGGQTRSDANFKSYPNNFVYSGDHNANADGGRGTYNRYWSASALDIDKSYRFGMTSSSVTPANTWNKWDAFTVRCIKI